MFFGRRKAAFDRGKAIASVGTAQKLHNSNFNQLWVGEVPDDPKLFNHCPLNRAKLTP
jgi:hypothetical protein